MQDFSNTISWLDHLALLIPPTGHVIVGAGVGSGSWVSYLLSRGDPKVTLIEADKGKLRHLQRAISMQSDWKLCDSVISDKSKPVSFYHASAANESGLIEPENLQCLWPNLRTKSVESRKAITLDDLLAKTSTPVNWLWVDCLPALSVVKGMESNLDSLDIIIARVLLEDEKSDVSCAALTALESYLEKHGFHLVSAEPSRHPLVGHAIFVRDMETKIDPLRADTHLLADKRSKQQLNKLDLPQNKDPQLQRAQALVTLEKIASYNVESVRPVTSTINHDALSFYQNLEGEADAPLPFLMLDSKSMPRSGLHYLKNTLARLLGEHFSFCEWYQEVGCCKQRPCSLTGYANHAKQSGECRIRLIKSHDFKHNDPYLDTGPHLQRLILIRDPLFTLTSWFELEQMGKYTDELAKHGIEMPKIWLHHEKELLESAYTILDRCFEAPGIDSLATWLVDKSEYIVSFLDRWVRPAIEKPDPYTHLVSYEKIDQYVVQLLKPYRNAISKSASKAVDHFAASYESNFKKRSNPFTARTLSVTSYFDKYSFMFEKAADHVESRFSPEIQALFKS